MAAAPTQTGRLCASGRHVMDPNWDICPYCDAENRSKERTLTEPYAPPPIAASSERRTTIGDAYPGSRRETKVMPGAGPSGPAMPAGQGDTRRIVGVIITYTWRPEGQLFLIREGKNFLGAGKVGSAPGEPDCDILIHTDPKMSSVHALILCRAGRYDIVDQESSNGTFLADQLVPLQGIELPNYAQITTGSTVWTFIKITPQASDKRVSQPAPHVKEEGAEPEPEPPGKPQKPDITSIG